MYTPKVVNQNLWTEHASILAEAYARNSNTVQFELVTRVLLGFMSQEPQRVVDVGGGYGRQAIMLARAGHSVVVVDCDQHMLDLAQNELAKEPKDVSARIELVLSDGGAVAELVGTNFDLACCHSVLMYQNDPVPMLSDLVNLVHQGGLISILSLNTEAIAMRSGLQGRWRETIASLQAGEEMDNRYLPSREYSRKQITEILEAFGASVRWWHGIGVFTDHLTETLFVDDPAEVILVEWLAGTIDPYRQVARCFHLIAERS